MTKVKRDVLDGVDTGNRTEIRNDVLVELTQQNFGKTSYGDPQYLAVLNRVEERMIVGPKSTQKQIDSAKENDPHYGTISVRGEHDVEWIEPVVAIGLPYDRDFRVAYIWDGKGEMSTENVYVEEIHARMIYPEIACAHEDTEIVPLPWNSENGITSPS